MSESKIVKAEIKFTFTQDKEPKARVTKKYEDGSVLEAEGIQSFEKAKRLLEDLVDNPIYVSPVDTITTGGNTETTE